jgi:acetylornithine/succinyldiaminopimelate/putrescine aminotransferase
MLSNRQLFYEYMGLPSARPAGLEISKARGVFLYGPDGKDYIDLVAGVTVSNLGHQNPDIVSAVKEQAANYMHLMVYGDLIQSPQVDLAAKLASLLPPNLQVTYFVSSGSEAIEGALKLAKRYTGRAEVISFANAYHGGTHGALSIAGSEMLKNSFRPLVPGSRQLVFNDIEGLSAINKNTACVVVETIQAEAGIILPEEGFLAALRRQCDKSGALLIIDDIQMGMGRTGKMFSFEHFGIVPDILCLAKAFGGGMPLGAFISSKDIMSSLTHNPELGHITTFGGHPVSCAAALAAVNYLASTGVHEMADQKAEIFTERLSAHPEIAEIRRKGLMMGIDLQTSEAVGRLIPLFIENGLLGDSFLFRPQAFRISPPLTITEEEIHLACDRILKSLDRI